MKVLRLAVFLTLGGAAGAVGWIGCSSSSNPSNLFTPTPDGSSDTNVPQGDSAPGGDAGSDAPTINPACIPSTVGTPTWAAPTGYPRSDCTSTQIMTLLGDCYGLPDGAAGDAASCTSDKASFATCNGCLFTNAGAGALGPLVLVSAGAAGATYAEVNYPGCLELEWNDASATSCAGEQGTLVACQVGACTACPPDPNGATGQITQCQNLSLDGGGPCASYAAAVNCPAGSSAATTLCYRQQTDTTFTGYAARVAEVFCGGADGGTGDDGGGSSDASDDAPDGD